MMIISSICFVTTSIYWISQPPIVSDVCSILLYTFESGTPFQSKLHLNNIAEISIRASVDTLCRDMCGDVHKPKLCECQL